MEEQKMLEAFGFIFKEERIESVDYNTLPGTFVVEILDPFPAYHGEKLPTEERKPGFLFFVTKERYTVEHVMRITQKIKKYFESEFVVDWGELMVNNQTYPSIRIKNLESYELISELQGCFLSEGVQFRKKQKVAAKALIKVHKYFSLEKTSDYCYKDMEDADMHYFQVPKPLNWTLFVKITQLARSNLNYNFDAATGVFYRRGGLVEVVRIYAKSFDAEKLVNCRNQYLELIDKYAN